MYDQLKYRFPGRQVIVRNGAFSELKTLHGFNGFIVSDFLQQNYFGFEEGCQPVKGSNDKVQPFVISREEYISSGARFLEELQSKELGKAVFSRVKRQYISEDAKRSFFDALCDEYPNALIYEIKSEKFGHWIGATPEVLLRGNTSVLETVALASTKKNGDSSPWGRKELKEQGLVAEFIENCLSESNAEFDRSDRSELNAGPVKHLINTFTIKNIEDPVSLIKTLHPTPAVSGLPRVSALDLIAEIEPHDRSLYTGFLGLIGDEYNLFVNLRCAQIVEDELFLYVGGGYTEESDVESEWEETENKARTLTRVMENL